MRYRTIANVHLNALPTAHISLIGKAAVLKIASNLARDVSVRVGVCAPKTLKVKYIKYIFNYLTIIRKYVIISLVDKKKHIFTHIPF